MAYRAGHAGVRHTCVRRPSCSVICHARGVALYREEEVSAAAAEMKSDAPTPPPSHPSPSPSPSPSSSSPLPLSRTNASPEVSMSFTLNHEVHSGGRSGPTPAASPTDRFPGWHRIPKAVWGPPPPLSRGVRRNCCPFF